MVLFLWCFILCVSSILVCSEGKEVKRKKQTYFAFFDKKTVIPFATGISFLIYYFKKKETQEQMFHYWNTYVYIEGIKNIVFKCKENVMFLWPFSRNTVLSPQRQLHLLQERHAALEQEHRVLQQAHRTGVAKNERLKEKIKKYKDDLSLKITTEEYAKLEVQCNTYTQKLEIVTKKLSNCQKQLVHYKTLFENLVASVEKRDALMVQAGIAAVYKQELEEWKRKCEKLEDKLYASLQQTVSYDQQINAFIIGSLVTQQGKGYTVPSLSFNSPKK